MAKKSGKGSMNSRQLAKLLKRYGFRISTKGKGSHGRVVDTKGREVAIIVVRHGSNQYSKSYVNTIIKEIGLDPSAIFA